MPTEQNLRIFLAISIPPRAVSNLQRQIAPLKPLLQTCNMRWIASQNWHITVKFIGSIAAQQISSLATALIPELCQFPRFQIELTTVDWFPSNLNPIMLAAMPANGDPLSQLAAHVDETLAHCGIKRNSRPFHAHLSLARCRRGSKQTSHHSLSVPLTPIRLTVDQLDLYQSQPGKQGVYYTKLASFPLLF